MGELVKKRMPDGKTFNFELCEYLGEDELFHFYTVKGPITGEIGRWCYPKFIMIDEFVSKGSKQKIQI